MKLIQLFMRKFEFELKTQLSFISSVRKFQPETHLSFHVGEEVQAFKLVRETATQTALTRT
jgi:hypothetical protein